MVHVNFHEAPPATIKNSTKTIFTAKQWMSSSKACTNSKDDALMEEAKNLDKTLLATEQDFDMQRIAENNSMHEREGAGGQNAIKLDAGAICDAGVKERRRIKRQPQCEPKTYETLVPSSPSSLLNVMLLQRE